MDMMIFTLFWVFGWVILLLVAWHLKSSGASAGSSSSTKRG